MTPSSPLGGLFVGLLDGLVITALVLLAVTLNNRRRHHTPAPVTAPAEPFRPIDATSGPDTTGPGGDRRAA